VFGASRQVATLTNRWLISTTDFFVMAEKLTERTVKALTAPSKGTVTAWDSMVRGFGVRVFAPTRLNPEGARSFFLNYRLEGTERRYTIGAYPTWSVDAARDEARMLRRRVDRGEDPASAKRERREAPTVSDLVQRYIAEHLPKKAQRSQTEDKAIINNEILSRKWLADRKVADVHFGDVERLHRELTERGVPKRANRTLTLASKMFSLSLRPAKGENVPWRDQAAGNPCKGIQRNPEEGHERFLSEAELAAVSDALNEYGAQSSANCIRFIMLTGCRPGEAMLATWDQMDAEPGFWVKPSAHTKQRKMHRAALSPAAIELLDRLRAARDAARRKGAPVSSFVFPGQIKGGPLKQLRSCWDWVTDRATVALWTSGDDTVARLVADLRRGLGREPTLAECRNAAARISVELPTALQDARIYDLRHTFASVGAGGGLSLHIIGRLLGHTQSRTTQRYAHLADNPMRDAAMKIGDAIAKAGKPKADVVPLPRRSAS
jgi:integrase